MQTGLPEVEAHLYAEIEQRDYGDAHGRHGRYGRRQCGSLSEQRRGQGLEADWQGEGRAGEPEHQNQQGGAGGYDEHRTDHYRHGAHHRAQDVGVLAVELPGSVAHLLGALPHILHYAVESVLLSAHLVTLAHCPRFGNHEPEDNVCRKRNPEPEAVARQGEEQEQDDGQQAEQQGFLVEIGRKAGADASEYLVVGVAVELALLSVAVAVG